eukprot:3805896-Amphidinium_carterae.1
MTRRARRNGGLEAPAPIASHTVSNCWAASSSVAKLGGVVSALEPGGRWAGPLSKDWVFLYSIHRTSLKIKSIFNSGKAVH